MKNEKIVKNIHKSFVKYCSFDQGKCHFSFKHVESTLATLQIIFYDTHMFVYHPFPPLSM